VRQGYIPRDAAQAAYSDPGNLDAMCRDCNSAKNGKKGVF
jgi:hypothetical protein